ALRRGYATSSTDTGHSTPGASFALGHPEKLVDYAWRSEHEMTVKAKAIIAAHYGQAPRLSYCNGIIAGAPASDWTGRVAASLRVAAAVHKDEAGNIPAAKYPAIHAAVVD